MSTQRVAPFQLWVIWLALLVGMGVILMVVGGGWPTGKGDPVSFGDPLFLVALGSFLASFFVRWGVLTQVKDPVTTVPVAVAGMALAEGTMMIGIFALPETAVMAKQILIVLAFLGMLSYAPVYAR